MFLLCEDSIEYTGTSSGLACCLETASPENFLTLGKCGSMCDDNILPCDQSLLEVCTQMKKDPSRLRRLQWLQCCKLVPDTCPVIYRPVYRIHFVRCHMVFFSSSMQILWYYPAVGHSTNFHTHIYSLLLSVMPVLNWAMKTYGGVSVVGGEWSASCLWALRSRKEPPVPNEYEARWAPGPVWRYKKNSMASVRQRTIPIEQPPFVGEVTANFLRIEGVTWSAWRIPTAVFSDF
jgi:hypothetical protein